jgi:hypothetical protein
MLSVKRFLVSVIGAGALTVGGVVAAAPAGAQGPVTQQGLVNITIQNVGVQIPVSLAANICDVNVAVLVDTLQDAPADCTAEAGTEANIVLADPGGPVNQQGLVNVVLRNVFVQVPIGIAANVCDVNVAVLVDTFLDAPADCNADATSQAFVTSNN